MYRFRPSWFAVASRFLYTHNPFYLISALLLALRDWNDDQLDERRRVAIDDPPIVASQ